MPIGVFVQIAEAGDDVGDASVLWPDNRTKIPFGTITLTARVDDQVPDRRCARTSTRAAAVGGGPPAAPGGVE